VAEHKAPGSAGGFAVAINTKDLKGLVNQLRNTLALQKDVQIEGGKLDARIDLAMTEKDAAVRQTRDVKASGTTAGKPVRLEPIHLETAVTATPNNSAIPDISNLAVDLRS